MIRLFVLLLLLCGSLVPASVSAISITSPDQLSPNPTIINFEDFQTGSNVITSLPNPLTIGGVTFTSLTGTLSIYNITAAGTWAADGTEVSHNTLFPGGEPDSAIAITFATPVAEFLVGWGDPNFPGNVLRAFDVNGNLLEEAPVELGGPGGGHAAWIGFKRATADIAKVIIQPDQSLPFGDDYAIDNIHYAPAVRVTPLSPGDILVANDEEVHHYASSGVDLGAFATGLENASWITIDRTGNVYVSEYRGNRIRKFSPFGANLLTIPTSYTPGGLAIANDGTIYVAHYDAGRVHRYSAAGEDLGVFATYGGCETGCGTDFIKFDSQGNLYVGDFQPLGRVRRISPTGLDLGNFITAAGVEGLAFDSSGNLYVSNYLTGVIEKYSPSGADRGAFASPATYGIAFDGRGHLWSAAGTGRIEEFSPTGKPLGGFGIGGRDLAIVPGPVDKDQCKKGGWQAFGFPRAFKNQGDCISFVNTADAVSDLPATGTFNYSYTFNSGWRARGSLTGRRSGVYITDVSAVTLTFECLPPSCAGPSSGPDGRPIATMAWNYATHFWDKGIQAVVSFDAALNNFQFINQPNYPPDFDAATLRYFEMHTVDPLYPFGLPPVAAQDSAVSRGDGETALNVSWTLSPASRGRR